METNAAHIALVALPDRRQSETALAIARGPGDFCDHLDLPVSANCRFRPGAVPISLQ